MSKAQLFATVSVAALGLALASTASANPKNKFSDGGVAQVNVTATITTEGGNSTVIIESNNTETEVLATNNMNATFSTGSVYTGNGAASAAATAAASAAATAAASTAATAAAAASADASADASAAASSNTIVTGAGNVGNNPQGGAQDASAAAAAAAAPAAAAAAADAAGAASAAAAADASASAAAAAARAGDIVNGNVVISGNAMERAAGAVAINMVSAQFVNANAANAIAAITGDIVFNAGQ